jgi:hypothetical protein
LGDYGLWLVRREGLPGVASAAVSLEDFYARLGRRTGRTPVLLGEGGRMAEDEDGVTIDERAEEHEYDPPEMFPLGTLSGDDLTPQKVVKRGLPVETTVALSRAEVPTSGGLMDPDKAGRCLVSYVPGKIEEVPQRDGDEAKVVGWKIRQHLRATYVQPAGDEADLIRAEFGALLELDSSAAGALLDELRSMAADALTTA